MINSLDIELLDYHNPEKRGDAMLCRRKLMCLGYFFSFYLSLHFLFPHPFITFSFHFLPLLLIFALCCLLISSLSAFYLHFFLSSFYFLITLLSTSFLQTRTQFSLFIFALHSIFPPSLSTLYFLSAFTLCTLFSYSIYI